MITCKHTIFLIFAASVALPAVAKSLPPARSHAAQSARVEAQPRSILDTLSFGDAASEQAHALVADQSKIVKGGLDETARVLLPRATADWQGGTVAFTMKVDPIRQNYFTIRLWGSDVSQERLVLFCEGKQIGYRHLGDIDLLDTGTDQPGYNGRFYYATSPMPLEMTQGKTALHCEIRSNGRVWGYGETFDKYQYAMTEPTRGMYCVYTHMDGCFVPPAAEKQGIALAHPPVRQTPGPEVLDTLKVRIDNTLKGQLAAAKPLNQQQMHLLSRAYFVPWTPAFHNPQAVTQIIKGLDALFAAYRKDPAIAQSAPDMYNGGWFGLGFAGDAVQRLAVPLQPFLDQTIDDGAGGQIMRRVAWTQMLQASRDWHRRNRRQYTNQSMITDLNIYTANRGVAVLDPAHAAPEAQMRDYLYQSMGLKPWLGSDTDHGPDLSLGKSYYQLTPHGLTKELGFVGYYGEVLDWATEIYDATRPAPDQPGDPQIKTQLVKLARARAVFRAPMVDADGNRAMRAETIVGWRDEGHYPGDVTYAERPTWDASPLYTAAATLDPELVGACQQMLADNQFFGTIKSSLADNSLRITNGLLDVPDQYALITAQSPSPNRLPMTPGQPDFVWADEEDGVLALKHGDTILYASLYWRARHAINSLARVHVTVPGYDRYGVVVEDEQFEPSGLNYTRPDWVNFGFGNGGLKYPDNAHSAYTGEKEPIAKIPAGITFKPGDESPYAGRASFYSLRYGSYLIGMNSTPDKTFTLAVPAGISNVPDLVSGKTVAVSSRGLSVGPMTTVVLSLGR